MFEELSVRDVETELVGMAGHLAAGTCRFLQLLAEFDTREGWAGPGLGPGCARARTGWAGGSGWTHAPRASTCASRTP